MQIALRGAANVWLAGTRNSIYIPTSDEQTAKRILPFLDRSFDTSRKVQQILK